MKNRTAIGIVCIILAVAVTFLVSPLVNKVSDEKLEVVRFKQDITQGTQITEEAVEVVEVSKSSLPDTSLSDKAAVVGKYATADLFTGDFATAAKLSDDANSADNVLTSLKGDKVAMSVTINSFAGGLSGKLENGDIVSICVTDKTGNTTVPAELKYVKVITTTTKGGIDENDVVENEDGSYELPSTITVLVSVKQAVILANNEENAAMHVALVYRGEDAAAQKFLDAQDTYLNKTADAGGAENE